MAEYVKHTGGSVAGKSKQPYDAMVYKDADSGYTIAVDGNGNVIKKVLSSANTDDVVIQAAINSVTTGTVYVNYGTYTINTRINIGENVKLEFDHNTIVKPATDIDMFYAKNGSRLSGCKIDVSDVIYTSSCILIDGAEKISSATSTKSGVQIENIWFYNDEYTGTAIYFKSTESGGNTGYIYGVIVDKIRIYKFNYGIRMYRTGEFAVNWINGNKFSNIRAHYTRKLIYMETDTGAGSDLDGNIFESIDLQSGDTPTVPAIVIRGVFNVITNCMVWDWLVGWSIHWFEFASNSRWNYAELDAMDVTYYVNNGLSTNTCYFTRIDTYSGTMNVAGSMYCSKLGVGRDPSYLLHIKGTEATDLPTYSAEFLDADNWTSADWTGSWAAGWRHPVGTIETSALNAGGTGYVALETLTVVQAGGSGGTIRVDTVDGSGVILTYTVMTKGEGYSVASGLDCTGGSGSGAKINILTINNTTVLSHDHAAVNATKYQIAYTVTGRTAGTFTITFGGQTSEAISATGAWGPTTTGTGFLQITPTADFNGTIVISIKSITAAISPVGVITSSSGSTICEIRCENVNTNTTIGRAAGSYNTTGKYNTFLGSSAGYNNTTGYSNVFIGMNVGFSNTIGYFNTFIGRECGFYNTTGRSNVFIGTVTGFNTTTGSNNVMIGLYAGYDNSTANWNTFVGTNAGQSTTTGGGNTFFGSHAGRNNTTGDLNTFIGYTSGYNANQKTDATNSMGLGYNSFTNRSNQVVIGNESVVETQLRANVYLGSTSSTAHTQPAAKLHIAAGSATAGTAPIKLTSGTLNTIPEAGAIEFNGSNFYFVI